MIRVMVVYGTRPEAIKLAPVIDAMKCSDKLEAVITVTGQHREMLDQVNQLFDIVPHHDLDVIQQRQTLVDVSTRVLNGLSRVLELEEPDAIVVQGDTTTAMVSGLAAFYKRIPVVHVEAGLRTENVYSPFPEEMNRRITSRLASLHCAPTATARDNLTAESVPRKAVVVTGNTVIDSLWAAAKKQVRYDDKRLASLDNHSRPVVLITSHRRESWGDRMAGIARAIARLALGHPRTVFVLPAHRNPAVREVLLPPIRGLKNVIVVEPVPYGQFARLMARCHLVLTDSGGVQEEAPSLGKPVLVMRDNTERPEGIRAGTAMLIGTQEEAVVDAVTSLLHDQAKYDAMARAVNPYGDGSGGIRTVAAIEQFFGVGRRLSDFSPCLDGGSAPRSLRDEIGLSVPELVLE